MLLVSTPGAQPIPIDIALAALPFEEEMITRAAMIDFGDQLQPRIRCAEDLVVTKAFVNRPPEPRECRCSARVSRERRLTA